MARVAMVTGGLIMGGSTTFLCNLAGELSRRGIPVQILSFEHANPMASDFDRLNIPVFQVDERHQIFEDRLQIILTQLSLFKPTVIVACLSASSFEVLRYAPSGVFRMAAIQSDDPGVYDSLANYVEVLDAIAAVSSTIKQKTESDARFAGAKVKYLPYGVPLPEHHQPSREGGPGALRILYLGRVDHEQKRVRLFPQILKHLESADIPFHWTIAGDGPDLAYLRSAMRTARPGASVTLIGAVAYSEVPKLLTEHDIFLLASDFEGLPLSLLEAMGCGLVPVVSDIPSGIREVVDKNTGRRIALDNTAGYAEAIITLHNDRVEMRRLSHNARERVRRDFSVGAMTDRWLDVFPKTIEQNITWPERWKIKPILKFPYPFYFSPTVRALRRALIKLRR